MSLNLLLLVNAGSVCALFGLEAEIDEEAYDETLDADLEEEDFADEDVAPEGTKTTYENSCLRFRHLFCISKICCETRKGRWTVS